jgi:hypothetical protein
VRIRLTIVALAAAAALIPLPPAAVERWYSTFLYPPFQSVLTGASNLVPFALLDVLVIAAVVLVAIGAARDIALRRRKGWSYALSLLATRLGALTAASYLLFLAVWGLNYRREPLQSRLRFDESRVAPGAAHQLSLTAVDAVNRAYASAHRVPETAFTAEQGLQDAFLRAERALAVSQPARPGRPKRSLIDFYFRWAGVSGMTDPYFLETLVASDVLPFERPMVLAHEWSHLAGFADESEANFLGWLTCVAGSDAAAYSGWLFLYNEVTATLHRDERAEIARRLDPGPREDLRASAEREQRNVKPALANAGWRAYDTYLKANRIESGTANYAEVVRLILGTEFDSDWQPRLN